MPHSYPLNQDRGELSSNPAEEPAQALMVKGAGIRGWLLRERAERAAAESTQAVPAQAEFER